MTKFMVTKRGGCLVPYGRHAEAAFDELPGGIPVVADIAPKSRRSTEQNRLMWDLLQDLSDGLVWHGLKYSAEDWKDCLTAAQKHARLMPGIDGGLVAIGGRTRDMSIKEMGELIDLIEAFGAQHGLVFRKAKETA
jgi:hypothetical protein